MKKNEGLTVAKALLKNLKSEIEKSEEIARKYSSEAEWKARKSRHWLHGATDTDEALKLEEWLHDSPPISKTGQGLAQACFDSWNDFIQEDGVYADFSEKHLDKPKEQERLIDYLIRLSQGVEAHGWGTKAHERALRSFLHFLRQEYPQKEIGFIEHIFPQKIELRNGSIIRKVQKEVYAISQGMATEILIELAKGCLIGRPNAQHTVAECLGLCWLCLTASRLRLPVFVESLADIKLTALRKGRYPTIEIPTLFGNRKIRISKRMANFLDALSKIPPNQPRETILQKPFRSLRRAFDEALQKTSFNDQLGNITFVTLLSPPHPLGQRRYQPK
jgi:hypothetical protein